MCLVRVPRPVGRDIETMAFLRKPQHDQPVQQHRHRCREGAVAIAVPLESLSTLEYHDANRAALVLADNRRAGRRQARVARFGGADGARRSGRGIRLGRVNLRAWRHDAHLGVVGQLSRAAASPLGQVPLRVGLHPPGDLPDEVCPVPRPARLAAELLVSLHEFTRGHPLQGVDLTLDGRRHVAVPFGHGDPAARFRFGRGAGSPQ